MTKAVWLLVPLLAACGSDMPPAAGTPDAAAAAAIDGAPPAADTWTNFADGFMQTYCDTCHSPGGAGYRNGELDFRSHDIVVANAAEIRCGTAPTQLSGCSGFPPPAQFPIAAPYPTDPERLRFVAWIEAGTPR